MSHKPRLTVDLSVGDPTIRLEQIPTTANYRFILEVS